MSGGHFPLYRSEIKSDSINSDVGIPQNINSPYFPGKSHNLKIKHRTANVLKYRCHISFNGIKRNPALNCILHVQTLALRVRNFVLGRFLIPSLPLESLLCSLLNAATFVRNEHLWDDCVGCTQFSLWLMSIFNSILCQ